MTSSLGSVERFLTNLAAAYGWMPKREMVAFWTEKLMRFDLTDDQWARAVSRIVATEETRPSLAQVFTYLRAQAFKRGAEIVPVWETFIDANGRCFAAKTGRVVSSVPSWEEMREWESHRATQEQGRECFRKGFIAAGGKSSDLEYYWSAMTAKQEAPRKPLWYQEQPDRTETSGQELSAMQPVDDAPF